jgi:transposase-like protein
MDSHGVFCPNLNGPARGQSDQGTIRVHSQKDQRSRCRICHKTFAATKGTPFSRLHAQREVFVSVITLLAFGCPPAASVAAFGLDERTVRAWQAAAGSHSEQVHQHLVLQPHELGQVHADELRVKKQGGIVWVAMARAIPTRWWLGGVVSAQRDGKLAAAIVALVCRCAVVGQLLWCVDGWKPYVPAIGRALRLPVRTGGRGRPSLRRWPGLSLAHVVKQHARRHLIGVLRRVVIGTEEQVQAMGGQTQGGGVINTAWIERREWNVSVTDEPAGATGAGACPTGGTPPSSDLLDGDCLHLLHAPWHALAASPASLHASDGGEADRSLLDHGGTLGLSCRPSAVGSTQTPWSALA